MGLKEGADTPVVRCKGAVRAGKRTQVVRRIEAVRREVANCRPSGGMQPRASDNCGCDAAHSALGQSSCDGSRGKRLIAVGFVSGAIDVGRYQVVQTDVSYIITVKFHSRTQL